MIRWLRGAPWMLLYLAGFLLLGVAGWWVLRWQAGVEVFGAAQAYLHDELGISQAQATVVGAGAGIAGAFLLTFLAISRRMLIGVGVIALALGLPAALLHDWIAEGRCFNVSTGKALCSVWQTPDGGRGIRRDDGAQPPNGWRRLRSASQDDVALYSGTAEEQAARRPRRVVFDTCATAPAFFEAGRARLYFAKAVDNDIEIWDRPGAHERTNVPLREVTPAVVAELCKGLDDAARKRAEQAEREARLRAEQELLQQEAARESERRAQAEAERMLAEAQAQAASNEAAARLAERALTAARLPESAVAPEPQPDDAAVRRFEAPAVPAPSRSGFAQGSAPDATGQQSTVGGEPFRRVRIR